MLKKYGFEGLETQMNEWNNACIAESSVNGRKLLGTTEAAARAAAMMVAMQQYSTTDIICYYDARIGVSAYGGMFNPVTLKPWPLYYSFAAFGELYRLGEQVECIYPRTKDVFALGATDGNKHAALFVNSTANDVSVETNLSSAMSAYAIDGKKNLELALLNPKKFTLKAHTVVLFKN